MDAGEIQLDDIVVMSTAASDDEPFENDDDDLDNLDLTELATANTVSGQGWNTDSDEDEGGGALWESRRRHRKWKFPTEADAEVADGKLTFSAGEDGGSQDGKFKRMNSISSSCSGSNSDPLEWSQSHSKASTTWKYYRAGPPPIPADLTNFQMRRRRGVNRRRPEIYFRRRESVESDFDRASVVATRGSIYSVDGDVGDCANRDDGMPEPEIEIKVELCPPETGATAAEHETDVFDRPGGVDWSAPASPTDGISNTHPGRPFKPETADLTHLVGEQAEEGRSHNDAGVASPFPAAAFLLSPEIAFFSCSLKRDREQRRNSAMPQREASHSDFNDEMLRSFFDNVDRGVCPENAETYILDSDASTRTSCERRRSWPE